MNTAMCISAFFKPETADGYYKLCPTEVNRKLYKDYVNEHLEFIEFVASEMNVPLRFAFTFICNNKSPRCVICGTYLTGFIKCCSTECRTKHRMICLKSDPEKYKEYTSKISKASKARGLAMTDEQKKKFAEIGRQYTANMTAEERKTICGKSNKNGNKEILQRWRENVSDEELLDMYNRRAKSMKRAEYDLSEYKNYKNVVRGATSRTYFKHKTQLNPNGFVRGNKEGQYHLDHIVSIFDCFVNNVDVRVVSSVHNLRIVPNKENLIKGSKSEMTIKDLLEKFNGIR